MKKHRTAEYRHIIDIQRNIVQDVDGNPEDNWIDIVTGLKAAHETGMSRQSWENGKIEDRQENIFYFRSPGQGVRIDSGMRVVFYDSFSDDIYYSTIKSVKRPNVPRREEWYIKGEELVLKEAC